MKVNEMKIRLFFERQSVWYYNLLPIPLARIWLIADNKTTARQKTLKNFFQKILKIVVRKIHVKSIYNFTFENFSLNDIFRLCPVAKWKTVLLYQQLLFLTDVAFRGRLYMLVRFMQVACGTGFGAWISLPGAVQNEPIPISNFSYSWKTNEGDNSNDLKLDHFRFFFLHCPTHG